MTQIATGVPIPEDAPTPPEPVKKTRARKAVSKDAKPSPAAGLIAALKFIQPAQKKSGTTEQQFAHISNGWVCAFNGTLTIGTPIAEDLTVCPHTFQFLDALGKIGEELAIAQIASETLSVTSEKFRGLVACVDPSEVPIPAPDANIAPCNDAIKTAMSHVTQFLVEEPETPVLGGVLLQAWTAVGTNGIAMLEVVHGVDLPPGMLIPKSSAIAIHKSSKQIVGFGYSLSSATFWFADGSFMKTQLYPDVYPAYGSIIECPGTVLPVPVEFFAAVKAVESFSDGVVWLEDGAVCSSMSLQDASTYKIEGMPSRIGFNVKALLQCEAAFKNAYFEHNRPNPPKVYFQTDNMRGCIIGIAMAPHRVAESPASSNNSAPFDYSQNYDDIPF